MLPLVSTLLLLPTLGGAWAQDSGDEDESTPGVFDEPLVPPVEAAPYEPRLRAFLAGAAGPALPLGPIGIGPIARLEVGAELPVIGGRLLPFASVGASAPSSRGSIQDDRLPEGESLDWVLAERQLQLGLGLHARLYDHGAAFSPELTMAPQLVILDARMESKMGNGAVSVTREQSTRIGWLAGLGIAARVGPGEAFGRLELTGVPADGVLAGDVAARSLSPVIGLRMPL